MDEKLQIIKKKKKPIPFAIKIVYLIILGLIVWQSFMYVSPIKGRVVDGETGRPMKGVNVRAGWVTG